MFEAYLKRGMLKKQPANFRQIERQVRRADKDLITARNLLGSDPEWCATIAYHAMLRAGRALLFSHGHLPADGGQHRTVVELVGKLLGKDYTLLVEKFEKMRRKRNMFFYETDTAGTASEAATSLEAAVKLVGIIDDLIAGRNPQQAISLGRRREAGR